jgi:hypothetical protein
VVDQDPTNWQVKTWLLVIVISSIGGFVNWINKYKTSAHLNIMELVGEITTSASVGVTVFMLATANGYSMLMSVAAASAAGHVATRLIYAVQTIINVMRDKKIKELRGE